VTFLAGSLLLGAVTFVPALLLLADQRDSTLVCSPLALALCLVPSLATLAWVSWSARQAPEQQLTAALGGTGLRMFVVLGAGLFLSLSVPFLRQHALAFWIWTLVYYLGTLALEIVILVRAQPRPELPADANSPVSASR
jgi:hypothetical protein